MIRHASNYQELLDQLDFEGVTGVQINRLPNCDNLFEIKPRSIRNNWIFIVPSVNRSLLDHIVPSCWFNSKTSPIDLLNSGRRQLTMNIAAKFSDRLTAFLTLTIFQIIYRAVLLTCRLETGMVCITYSIQKSSKPHQVPPKRELPPGCSLLIVVSGESLYDW